MHELVLVFPVMGFPWGWQDVGVRGANSAPRLKSSGGEACSGWGKSESVRSQVGSLHHDRARVASLAASGPSDPLRWARCILPCIREGVRAAARGVRAREFGLEGAVTGRFSPESSLFGPSFSVLFGLAPGSPNLWNPMISSTCVVLDPAWFNSRLLPLYKEWSEVHRPWFARQRESDQE